MGTLLERIEQGEILVADGAMGTMLFQRGVAQGECPEAVALERPEVLQEIAAAYRNAGADMVQTNTFGGSVLKLEHYGLAERCAEINRKAVEAVRAAVGNDGIVSGSCGPCGKMLEPYGDAKADDVQASFATQMEALVAAGVDVICVETMMDITEATLAVSTARQIAGELPIIATMTFDTSPRGFRTMMGVDIPQAAEKLVAAGANIVGSNCGNGSARMVEIAKAFREATDAPLLIQSNAGLPQEQNGTLVYPESPEDMAQAARALIALGVQIIGGCCGTGPEHIAAIRRVVDEANGSR